MAIRRVVTAAGAVASATLLALSAAQPAHAALGSLLIPQFEGYQRTLPNPHGCHAIDPAKDKAVQNLTDEPATLYSGAGCTGTATELRRFETKPLAGVHSLYIY